MQNRPVDGLKLFVAGSLSSVYGHAIVPHYTPEEVGIYKRK